MLNPEMLRLIAIGVTALGALAWCFGVAAMSRATRERRAAADAAALRFEIEGEAPAGSILGEAEVAGSPVEIADKLAAGLARDGLGIFGPVKILDSGPGGVRFESAGGVGLGVKRGRVTLAQAGSTTRVTYAIEPNSRMGVKLGIGWTFVAVGLVALVVIPGLIFTLVLPQPNPDQGLALQVIQVGQFLWEPFVFAGQVRGMSRAVRGRVEAMIHNLPYA